MTKMKAIKQNADFLCACFFVARKKLYPCLCRNNNTLTNIVKICDAVNKDNAKLRSVITCCGVCFYHLRPVFSPQFPPIR